MNKDQIKGREKEGADKVKEVAGKIVGGKEMEVKGEVKKNIGKAQASYGDAKNDIKNF